MNILILNVDHQPHLIGGIKRVSSILAYEWQQMGHKVWFIGDIPLDQQKPEYEEINGVKQLFLPSEDLLSNQNKTYLISLVDDLAIDIFYNPHCEERAVSQLCFLIRENTRVKLVSAWHFSPTMFIDEKDAYHIHYPVNKDFKSWLRSLKWRFIDRKREVSNYSEWFKEIERRSDKFVLLSERFIPAIERLINYHSDKIIAINNPSVFNSTNVNYENKQNSVIWCGRLGHGIKRTDIMVNIWAKVSAKHPDWKCYILGSGDTKYWKDLVAKRNIANIEFMGFCDPKQYYEQAKIFCLTSASEGWGLVLIEAMTFGCVPIAFDSFSSLHDIVINGENGCIVPAFNIDAYSNKLSHLMEEADQLKNMSEKSQTITTKFVPGKIASQWINMFQSLV